MNLLTLIRADAGSGTAERVDQLSSACASGGHVHEVRQLSPAVDRDLLLDDILAAQADVVLIAGLSPADQAISQIADVVWKFDSDCRVALLGACTVAGVRGVVADSAQDVLAALLADGEPAAADPHVVAAILVSRGWARADGIRLPASEARQILAAVARTPDLTYAGDDGYQHSPGVLTRPEPVFALLGEPRLGSLVDAAMNGRDMWLSAVEAISATRPAWRRELLAQRLAAASPAFRPGLSVLVSLDSGGRVDVHPSSHRLAAAQIAEPATFDQLTLAQGEPVLIEAGCAYRLAKGTFLHLSFVLGWMKPQLLMASALPCLPDGLSEQARKWLGIGSSLPTSVGEFLRAEEAALSDTAARRKGTGI